MAVVTRWIWPHLHEAGTARPVTTNKPRTPKYRWRAFGRDERAVQLNEFSDASKLNGSSISASPLDRRRARIIP
jgi:hypothetical protein